MNIEPPFYYCYVEGKGTPKVQHATLEEARTEADRLRSSSLGHRVWILAPLESLEPLPKPEPPTHAPSGRPILRVKKTTAATVGGNT